MDISTNYKHLKLWTSSAAQKKLIKNGENVPSLEVVEVVLVQCNLVDNQSKVLYTSSH